MHYESAHQIRNEQQHQRIDDQQEKPQAQQGERKRHDLEKNPRVAFTSPITTAAINAERRPSTSNPGTRCETTSSKTALIIHLTSN